VTIAAVSPDPRTTAINEITLTAGERVTGFELSDLILTRNGGPNLLTAAQTLTTTDNITFTLGNLAGLTAEPGDYVLALVSAGSGITDGVGNPLAAGASDAWRTVLVGDFNADFAIGALDLHILQTHLGMTAGASHFDGDMDGDGAVGRTDAALFAMVYGRLSPPLPPPVPSPAPAIGQSEQPPLASRRVLAARRSWAQAGRSNRAVSAMSSAAVDRVFEVSPTEAKPSVLAGPTLRARRHVFAAAQRPFPTV
jgi:hypothetical protein